MYVDKYVFLFRACLLYVYFLRRNKYVLKHFYPSEKDKYPCCPSEVFFYSK